MMRIRRSSRISLRGFEGERKAEIGVDAALVKFIEEHDSAHREASGHAEAVGSESPR